MSLNNQANLRSEVGDRAGALAAIDEAVSHYRQLAEANPAAFLPDLAMSLNNQANRRSEVGDRAGALAAIDEAVSLRRQLAEANPAAFLPNLAGSLNNQANLRSEVGDRNGALAAFADCWTSFTPGPRAELMTARSRWRLRHTDQGRTADLDGAIGDLVLAVTTAAEPDQPQRSGAARQAVRATAAHLVESSPITEEALSERLPAWVTTDIPDPVVDILNRWLAARDWADREALIRATAAALLTDNGQSGIALACFLYPDADDLTELTTLLEQIRLDGLEPVLSARQDAHAHAADLRAWLATPTWEQSRTFLREHPDLVSDPRTLAVLESAEKDPMASQHLAILRLIQSDTAGSLDDVYDAITDPTVAADLAMTCLEHLDTTTLDNLLHAAPNLLRTAFVGPYLLAARSALSAPENTAQANPSPMIELAIQTGTTTQRAAGATRLRRIARRRPTAATALEEMAAQLDAANGSGTG
jgi:tetratricopeptide (TPR) repeat protein